MKISEATFRRILREEARRTRIFEVVTDAPAEVGSSVGAAAPAAASAQQQTQTAAAQPASANNRLTDEEITKLREDLNELAISDELDTNYTMGDVERVHNLFISQGIFNTDLWTGWGDWPAEYAPEVKEKYKKIFTERWRLNQEFRTDQLEEIISNDPDMGYTVRLTGQWDDGNCQQLERVHNKLLKAKRSIAQAAQAQQSQKAQQAPAVPTPAAGFGFPSDQILQKLTPIQQVETIVGVAAPTGKWSAIVDTSLTQYIIDSGRIIKDDRGVLKANIIGSGWKQFGPKIRQVGSMSKPNGYQPTVAGVIEFLRDVSSPASAAPAATPAPAPAPAAAAAVSEGSWRHGDRLVEGARRVSIRWGR